MKWPLNHSMLLTKEQADSSPWMTILLTFIMYIVNIFVTAIATIPFIFQLMSKENIDFTDPSASSQIQEQVSLSSSMTYVSLFLTIIMIIIALLFARWFQGRKSNSFGFTSEDFFRKYGIGILVAAVTMGLTYLINLLFGTISSQMNPEQNGMAFILLLIGFMIQGLSEEVLLRGYMMNGIAIRWGAPAAILINSILFGLMHLANPGISWLAIVNLILAGIFFSLLFYITDNLWLTGAAHSFWNFIMGVIFGVQVSGLVLPGSILVTKAHQQYALINGGEFGFEGGLVVTVILIISCLLFLSKVKHLKPVK